MSFSSHCYAFQYVLELHYPKRPCSRLLPPRLLVCEQLTTITAVDVFRSMLSRESAELLRLLGQEELRFMESLQKRKKNYI